MVTPKDTIGYLKDMVLYGLEGIIFIILATTIHEYLGHALISNILKCEYSVTDIFIFTGSTLVKTCPLDRLLYIALAGPLAAFFIGLLFWAVWYFTRNLPELKVASYILWLYGTIPNLTPFFPENDMFWALKSGLNPFTGILIFLLTTAIIFALIFDEAIRFNETDKEEENHD